MIEIALSPDLWKDIDPGTEALVDAWLVKPSDTVSAGQVLAKVVLVKTTIDVLAPADGVIEQILVPAEDTFKPGQALALLRTGS